jgi:hypothetical protein
MTTSQPLALVLFCPSCRTRHVDRGEWATRRHRTHRCDACGHEWQPADVASVGVADEGPVVMVPVATLVEREQLLQQALTALDELVALKDLKDQQGKTHDYTVRQPTAWRVARLVLDAAAHDTATGLQSQVITWRRASLHGLPTFNGPYLVATEEEIRDASEPPAWLPSEAVLADGVWRQTDGDIPLDPAAIIWWAELNELRKPFIPPGHAQVSTVSVSGPADHLLRQRVDELTEDLGHLRYLIGPLVGLDQQSAEAEFLAFWAALSPEHQRDAVREIKRANHRLWHLVPPQDRPGLRTIVRDGRPSPGDASSPASEHPT